MSKIISIQKARLKPDVLWSLAELAPGKGEEWLNSAIDGSELQGLAMSLWAHHPNLKRATQKFAAMITPKWPTQLGKSLLTQTLENALLNVQVNMAQGDAITGRMIGTYLGWIANSVEDVVRLSIYGETHSGECIRWPYFTQPLKEWADENGIKTLMAKKNEGQPDPVIEAGLRMLLITSIAHPTDVGYVSKYAHKRLIFSGEMV